VTGGSGDGDQPGEAWLPSHHRHGPRAGRSARGRRGSLASRVGDTGSNSRVRCRQSMRLERYTARPRRAGRVRWTAGRRLRVQAGTGSPQDRLRSQPAL